MAKLSGNARSFLVTVVAGGVATGACVVALLPGAVVLATSHHYTSDALGELSNLAERSTVVDTAGNTIATLGLENRKAVPLSDVPQVLIDAVIATEDKTFWENDGIDYNAILRAGIKNLTAGEIVQGGSSITQQLVKNRILNAERDFDRKLQEFNLALRLNDQYSKEEILEQYLNTVYLGQGSYGVKSATERFFSTPSPFGPAPGDLSKVTLGQAALLAGLISNPEGNNPFVTPDRARSRRNFVLKQMVNEGYATKKQAAAAKLEPLPTVKPEAELRPKTSWAEEVQDQLINNDVYSVLGTTPKARRDRVLSGGLTIHASLDPDMQQAAQAAMDAILPEKPGFTGALVAIDPNTGLVRAMVAGPGFEDLQYNIATSPPGRQEGSTWKTITLAAALESGYSPDDRVSGVSPCEFGQYGRTQNAEGGGGRINTLRAQTVGSVNCAYARTELSVGFPKVIDTAHKMGITQQTLTPVLTLTLGAIESTPLEMATVASTIAAGGIHHTPLFVERIEGPNGEIVFDARDVPGERAISAETAACEADILKGVVTGGTGTAARLNGREAAGKTGTTDSRANAAFIGFTPQLAAFVWHGNIEGNVPGAGFGGDIPARIWKRFMDAALQGQPAVPLPAPGPACSRPPANITEFGRLPGPLLDELVDEFGRPILVDGFGNPVLDEFGLPILIDEFGNPIPSTPPPTVIVGPTTTTGPIFIGP